MYLYKCLYRATCNMYQPKLYPRLYPNSYYLSIPAGTRVETTPASGPEPKPVNLHHSNKSPQLHKLLLTTHHCTLRSGNRCPTLSTAKLGNFLPYSLTKLDHKLLNLLNKATIHSSSISSNTSNSNNNKC